MRTPGRVLLLVAAGCSAVVAALHVAILLAGPAWYRYFGAPSLAARIEAGAGLVPWLMTVGVAALFAVWAGYGLSGAGVIGRWPLLRAALYTIAAVYLLRGLELFPDVVFLARGRVPLRFAVFSLFSAFAGIVYLLGAVRSGRPERTPAAPAHA